jgi:diguanylate cyclase (GGDEF)-like protein
MTKRILIADDEPSVCQLLELVLKSEGYDVVTAQNGDQLVRLAQERMPDLLLVDLMMPQLDGYEAIRQLRNDTRTAHLPMLILTAKSTPNDLVTGFESGADDYITKPFVLPELLARIKGHLRRAAQRPVHNPLTGLAGNVLLTEELKYRIKRGTPFALLYIDLDNFKAFNDTYGFSRGDRAIKLVADVLREALARYGDESDFIGHIGGDDFALISSPDLLDQLCQCIIERFDAGVRQLYDAEDLQRGYLRSTDRQGVPRRFPIMTISIGGVTNLQRQFTDDDQVSRVAAEMKSFAKTRPGSTYEVDARREHSTAIVSDRRGTPVRTALLLGADTMHIRQLAEAFQAAGYRTLEAFSALDAHTILAHETTLSLALADARLGDSLWDVCDSLHSSAPTVPVLLLVSGPDDEQLGHLHNVQSFIHHTAGAGELLARADELIDD